MNATQRERAAVTKRLAEIRGDRTMANIATELGVAESTWYRAEDTGKAGPLLRLALLRKMGIDLDA